MAKFLDLGVDSVVPLARRKPVTKGKCVKRIGDNDLLIRRKRPCFQKAKSSFSREELERLPQELLLRQIKVTVSVPGYRVEEFYIITTLLDDALYTAGEITDLYFRRWDVELFFRDLKTTMEMDVLRCMTPSMIRKELQMYFIVYNCIRCLMGKGSAKNGTVLSSFCTVFAPVLNLFHFASRLG
jgi:IS4 transposase